MFLADNASTHIIIRDKIYFTSLTLKDADVNTVSGITNLIEGSRRANIMCQKGQNFILVMHYILANSK